MIFGETLAIISGVSWVHPNIRVAIYPTKIESIIEKSKHIKATLKNLSPPLAIVKPSPLIGRRSGAISIAPIITATEFCNNHRVAIILDKNISSQ